MHAEFLGGTFICMIYIGVPNCRIIIAYIAFCSTELEAGCSEVYHSSSLLILRLGVGPVDELHI